MGKFVAFVLIKDRYVFIFIYSSNFEKVTLFYDLFLGETMLKLKVPCCNCKTGLLKLNPLYQISKKHSGNF